MTRKAQKVKEVVGKWMFLEGENGGIDCIDRTQIIRFYCETPSQEDHDSRFVVHLSDGHFCILEIPAQKLFELLNCNKND